MPSSAPIESQGEAPTNLWHALRDFDRGTKIFLLFTAINSTAFGIYALCFNLYAAAIGYTNAQIGALNAVPAIGMLAIGLPSGFLVNRFGFRRFLVLSTGLMTVAPLALWVFGPKTGSVSYIILFSIGNSLIWVLSGPLLAGLGPPQARVQLFSLNAFILTVSIALGSLIGGAIPEWRATLLHISANSAGALGATFIASGVLNALSFALVWVMKLPQPLQAAPAISATKHADVAVHVQRNDWGLFARLVAPSALIGLGAGAFITFQQLYFRQRFLLSPGPIATIFAISQGVTALAILLAPLMAQHIGRVRTAIVTQFASIPLLILLGFTNHLALALGAFYVRGALMNMGAPVAEALAMDLLPPSQRAAYSSVTNALGNLGRGGIGPLISGALQVIGGYGAAFSFTALTYAVSSICYFAFFRHVEPDYHLRDIFGPFARWLAIPTGASVTRADGDESAPLASR